MFPAIEEKDGRYLRHVKPMTMVITLTDLGDTTQDSDNIALLNTSSDIIQMKETLQCWYLFLISEQLKKIWI